LPAEEAEELARIALASLEAKPIGAFHIVEQQVDGTSYYIKDGEWPIDTGIIEVYAASPMTVVLNDVSGPLALAYKELTPAIMRNHIAVFERYGITPNDSITTIHALRIALDGIERSDAVLHGAEPVSQTYKLNELSGNSPVTPDGWISCSDRMPEDTKMLLAFSQGEIVAAYWNWVVNPIDYKKYRAFTYLSGNILDDVTHWMPLPEPPL
ncbi:DUF551 domain-containing protein, partial [Escherichia coli]|nr:DUF551 domain-containing protein [Escherichia coli]